MPDYQAQVTIMPVSNLLEDAAINTFSFSALSDADLPSIVTALTAAYVAFRPSFSNLVRQNTHRIKIYNRADAVPRAPDLDTTFNLDAAPGFAPAPTEVAVCVSFQAAPTSGVPQARRRGRVYLGPVSATQIDTTGRPNTTLRSNAVAFGQSLLDASQAAANWEWVVFSALTGAPAIITNGWVDDEFDIQRRRGRKPTLRTTFV